jgi:lipoyl-dependent peroxiredoxin
MNAGKMRILYTTTVTTHGGREGIVESADGKLHFPLSLPKELGGAGGDGTNPEQLFAAGYSACFESALRLVARRGGRPVEGVRVTATVALGKVGDGYRLAVELRGTLPGLSGDEASAMMQAAHAVCPYSAATRGNVDVTLVVDLAQSASDMWPDGTSRGIGGPSAVV